MFNPKCLTCDGTGIVIGSDGECDWREPCPVCVPIDSLTESQLEAIAFVGAAVQDALDERIPSFCLDCGEPTDALTERCDDCKKAWLEVEALT